MKSSKQRRDEIKAKRLERAARLAGGLTTQDVDDLKAGRSVPGIVRADQDALARYNRTARDCLPRYYVDQAFTCCDCGTQGVWTAKQQKWWYEVIGALIYRRHSGRCPTCRRAHRALKAAERAANPLNQQVGRLRALGSQPPTAEAQAEVDAALHSKWWSVRTVAIETLGRWGGPEQVAQLQALIAGKYAYKPQALEDSMVLVDAPTAYQRRNWAYAAAVAAGKALQRIEQGEP